MKYCLKAANESGARINIFGKTITEVLEQFDSTYSRAGFKISIYDVEKRKTREIKKTYR